MSDMTQAGPSSNSKPLWKRKRVIIPVALVAAIAFAGQNGGSSDGAAKASVTTSPPSPGNANATPDTKAAATPGSHPAVDDVTIASCGMGDYFGPEAKVSVVNHSSKPSNYFITVTFESADGARQLDTGYATVNTLQPGQTGSETASSMKSELRNEKNFTCKVADVTRTAS